MLRNMIRSEGLPLEERDQAVAEMEWLAESGDRNAQYFMGKLLQEGPLLIPDVVKARRWLKTAAENDSHYAAYRRARSTSGEKSWKRMSLRR